MKISAQEEYGLRCLVQLANLKVGESLTLPQIAERSTRGTKGGYFLARPAEEIYLNEIIKVLDEDVLSAHCGSYTGVLESCVHNGDCGIRPVIVGLHEIVQSALSKITLASLVGNEEAVDAMFHQIQGLHKELELPKALQRN
jgi:Rrf2 family iron-sulfur cluster assembly transcriptional regulator